MIHCDRKSCCFIHYIQKWHFQIRLFPIFGTYHVCFCINPSSDCHSSFSFWSFKMNIAFIVLMGILHVHAILIFNDDIYVHVAFIVRVQSKYLILLIQLLLEQIPNSHQIFHQISNKDINGIFLQFLIISDNSNLVKSQNDSVKWPSEAVWQEFNQPCH